MVCNRKPFLLPRAWLPWLAGQMNRQKYIGQIRRTAYVSALIHVAACPCPKRAPSQSHRLGSVGTLCGCGQGGQRWTGYSLPGKMEVCALWAAVEPHGEGGMWMDEGRSTATHSSRLVKKVWPSAEWRRGRGGCDRMTREGECGDRGAMCAIAKTRRQGRGPSVTVDCRWRRGGEAWRGGAEGRGEARMRREARVRWRLAGGGAGRLRGREAELAHRGALHDLDGFARRAEQTMAPRVRARGAAVRTMLGMLGSVSGQRGSRGVEILGVRGGLACMAGHRSSPTDVE
jgi:hypothetical protein